MNPGFVCEGLESENRVDNWTMVKSNAAHDIAYRPKQE